MSKTASEAVKLLISADDQASRKFQGIETAADKFADKMREVNSLLSGKEAGKLIGPLTEMAGRFTAIGLASKALKETLKPVFEGADEMVRKKFAEPLAEGAEALENIRGGLKDVGAAIAEAFSDSNFGEYAKKLLSGTFSLFQTGAKESEEVDAKMQARAPGFGTRDNDAIKKALQGNQEDLAQARARERDLMEKRGTNWVTGRPNESPKLDTERSNIRKLQQEEQRLRGLLSAESRDIKNLPFLNLLGPTEKQTNAALAKMFGAGKLKGESPFTKEFGRRAEGIPEGLGGLAIRHAEEQARAKLAGEQDLDRRRKADIEENKTAKERLDEKLSQLEEEFPEHGEEFNRAVTTARKKFADATKGPEPQKAPQLGDNAAVVSRFGGGIVKGGPMQELVQLTRQQLLLQNKAEARAQQQAKKDAFNDRRPQINVVGGFPW